VLASLGHLSARRSRRNRGRIFVLGWLGTPGEHAVAVLATVDDAAPSGGSSLAAQNEDAV